MTLLAVLLVALFLLPLGFTAPVAHSIAPADLAWGQWALLFVVVPGCPACDQASPWFARAAQIFPEIRFLLVAPGASRELEDLSSIYGLPWLSDPGGQLGAWLGVRRAPTVILLGEGVPLGRLDWPFTEEALTQELARFLDFRLPTPRDLLGGEAPRFGAEDLSGREVTWAELPRPLLLVLFNPDCPPCWEALPALAEIAREVAVAVVAVVSEAGLAPLHRERFAGFVQAGNGHPRLVLIARDLEVLRLYRVVRTPTYILVDGKGVVTWVADGLIPSAKLVEAVRAALEGR